MTDRIDIFVDHMAERLAETKAVGIVLNVEKPFYGRTRAKTPRHAKAAVELMTKLVETTPGNFVQSTHWLSTDFAIEKKDRIWLPGFDETKDAEARLPLSVAVVPDDKGVEEHREVRL